MGKTIICHTLTMSTLIIILYLCMVTTCSCICTGASKNPRSSAVYIYIYIYIYVQKEYSLVWLEPFLVQGIYCLQYKHPATCMPCTMVVYATWLSICTELSSMPTIACSKCHGQLATTFTLNFEVAI